MKWQFCQFICDFNGILCAYMKTFYYFCIEICFNNAGNNAKDLISRDKKLIIKPLNLKKND